MSFSQPVKCRLCKHTGHIIIDHVENKHGISPADYMERFADTTANPLALLASPLGWSKIQEAQKGEIPQTPRRRVSKPFVELFPTFKTGDPKKDKGDYPIFAKREESTPKLDQNYLFPERQTIQLLLTLRRTSNNRPYIKGWSGTGKSSLVENCAAICRAPFWRINANKQMTWRHLVGAPSAKNGETGFQFSTVPLWLKHGGWLLINEYDTLNPDTANELKPVLEDPPRLPISELGITLWGHPDCRVIVTANTWGRGDPTGQFAANTAIQSAADLRRFSAFIELDYMEPEIERAMLCRIFNVKKNSADAQEIKKVVDVATAIRDSFKAHTSDRTISPAELINLVETAIVHDIGWHEAFRLAYLNTLNDEPGLQQAIWSMFTAVFPENP